MDIKLTKIISGIHFSISTFFIFIVTLFLIVFILLQDGIYLRKIELKSLEIDALYIKCNNGLILSAQNIDITKSNIVSNDAQDSKTAASWFDTLSLLRRYIRTLDIVHFHMGDINGSLRYKNAFLDLNVTTPSYTLDTNIMLSDELLFTNQMSFQMREHPIRIGLKTLYQRHNNSALTRFDLNVSNSDTIVGYIRTDDSMLSFNIPGEHNITHLADIVNALDLDPEVPKWINDYPKGDVPVLEKFYGTFDIKDPKTLVNALHAKAHWDNVDYTFARGFKPAHAKRGIITFENGKLHIKPIDATFYSHQGGNTALDIDFTLPDPTLILHIDTNAILDATLIKLIHHYGITLPLKQHSGSTYADLTLNVNLITLNTHAKGTFDLQDTNLTIYQEPLYVQSGQVILEDSNITLKEINTSYYNSVFGTAEGTIDVATDEGSIRAAIKRVTLFEDLSLAQPTLDANYTFSPHRPDILSIAPSSWNYKNHRITIDPIQSVLDYDSLRGVITNNRVYLDDHSYADVNVDIDLKAWLFDFNANIKTLHLDQYMLKQSPLHVSMHYDGNSSVIQSDATSWLIDGMALETAPIHITKSPKRLILEQTKLAFLDAIHFDINGSMNTEHSSGDFDLSNLDIQTPELGSVIHIENAIPANIKQYASQTHIALPSMQTEIIITDKQWELHCNNLALLAPYSKMLQHYGITSGTLLVQSDEQSDSIAFSSTLHSDYKWLVKENLPQDTYTIKGILQNQDHHATINDTIEVQLRHNVLSFDCNKSGFNLPDIAKFLQDSNNSESHESNITLVLNAANSSIYLAPNRRILSDSITLSYGKHMLLGTLMYNKGRANLEMQHNDFYLYGDNLNDTFMNALFSLSEHKGGSFSITARGKLDDFMGVAKIENTRIKDYVLFNNMLAFINTIPALASFSFPSYEQKGIKVNNAYSAFHYQDQRLYFSDINLNSKEFSLYGNGSADVANNTIDLLLNLKTSLGKNVSNVPIVGYILVGDDGTAATSFQINGPIDNPKIQNAIARDIIVAPFNILLRTVTYPFHLLESLMQQDNNISVPAPTRF